MIKMRIGAFETNSSAVHCLVVPREELQKPELKLTKDKKIKVRLFNDFDGRYIWTQEEKLSYLITQIYYKNCGYDLHILEDDYEFKYVEEVVSEYVGAKGFKIDYSVEPDINHQAQWGNYVRGEIVDTCDKESVLSFIFSTIMVKEYRD